MNLSIELEQEDDGRWIAEVEELNGVMVYGTTEEEALAKVTELAASMMADSPERKQ
ncbi:MAG: type II toxin-antitoxin system HicB family antitoxin [Acidobacteria bacterium]|nr:type II toxin-antitoxin system HicB family antitoxin [Acidobacteriota bacterium]